MSPINLPKHGRHSIRFKLVIASIIVQIAVLSLLVWNNTRLASEHLIQQAEAHIQETLPLLNASVAGPFLQEDIATLGEILGQVINEHNLRYIAIFNTNDNLLIKRGVRSASKNNSAIKNMPLQQHIASNAPKTPYRLRAPITIANSVIGYLELEFNTLSIEQTIASIRKQGVIIAAAGIVLSIFLLTFLAITITRNLLKLTNAVSSLSPGDDPVDVIINTKDEVGGLALAFNEMTKKLQLREQERDAAARATQASDARYRRLVENLSAKYFFYSHDTDGILFYVSESITDVLGYTQNDFLSHYSTYLTDNPINNDNLAFRKNQHQTGEKCLPFIISVYHKNGEERMLEVSESPVLDVDGKIVEIEGIAHDITLHLQEADELRQHQDNLEILVAKRTSELETINNELESFCYSVSHDLRAPLRGINGFSNALLEDYAHTLDDTGKNYLTRITHGTQRMSSLIDDLLNLSRITRYKMKIQPVDLTNIAKEIVQTLRDNEPNRSVNITIEESMRAVGDKNLLTIALSNLIGNAWKYTGKCDDATINIDSSIVDGTRIFSISDNGAGFNIHYIDKIFLPFQRLHRADDFPGNGVGLSTVHRVISRHQGTIWARAKVDEGASFHFTLNIKEQHSEL